MKRAYRCAIVGSGTNADPFRPALDEAGVDFSDAVIPVGADGRPLFGWAVVVAAGSALALAQLEARGFGERLRAEQLRARVAELGRPFREASLVGVEA